MKYLKKFKMFETLEIHGFKVYPSTEKDKYNILDFLDLNTYSAEYVKEPEGLGYFFFDDSDGHSSSIIRLELEEIFRKKGINVRFEHV